MRLKASPEDFLVREHLTLHLAPGPHTLYILRKRQWNTEDCIQWLSDALRIPRKRFGVCGNKDRQAITEQYITIERGPQTVRTPEGFTLTALGTTKDALRMGAHDRNFFTITVRELPKGTKKPELIPIKNYFGEQRMSTQNADVGFALLRKDYKAAATILGLEFTTDPISALKTVPRHVLILYVHAAQSVIWNEVAEMLPATQDDIPMPGYEPQGNLIHWPAIMEVLKQHGFETEEDGTPPTIAAQVLLHKVFINRSMQELSLEGGSRSLLQDVQDFSASEVKDGVCILSFSLGKGSYATETLRQLFEK